ncbi:hypothetical protein L1856_30080 [Streptomyces sp. Tue 6430]|nr:hypothetical protein [Streptomyces sp. Tue 6430]
MRAAYAATASASVVGYAEQAKDRLVFATLRLNLARQADDSDRPAEAARHLRAAEGAIAQAAVLVGRWNGRQPNCGRPPAWSRPR